MSCRWLGASLGMGRYKCHSPLVTVPKIGITEEGCARCVGYNHPVGLKSLNGYSSKPVAKERPTPSVPLPCVHRGQILEYASCDCVSKHVHDCEIHERCTIGPNNGAAASCNGCRDRKAQEDLPENPMRWAYAITTAVTPTGSRRGDLFPRTLASLKAAGFDSPKLFVDGDRDGGSWEREFGLETVTRYPNIRTYGHWALSLAELYIRNPEAERYAMFQDDFVTGKNLRRYLERCPYPERGYWNLYTFGLKKDGSNANHKLLEGKKGWHVSNQNGRGAVALVFDRATVVQLLSHRHFVERPQDPKRGWRAVDGGVVSSLTKSGWKEYVHNPSLVQHTGLNSSMGNPRFEPSPIFPGEGFDFLSLL